MKRKLLGCSFFFCLSTTAWTQVPDPDSELDLEMQMLVNNGVNEHPAVSALSNGTSRPALARCLGVNSAAVFSLFKPAGLTCPPTAGFRISWTLAEL